jgi:hypothetical protein
LNRSNFFPALLLLTALPPGAQAPQPRYLPNADTVCEAALPDGTSYEAWDRVFLTSWMGQPLYVKVRAYYRPGSGEFLWRSTGLPKTGYAHALKENSGKARTSCEEPRSHILLLQDGEWADFWAHGGRITVFHCNLKLHTREKVWSYIAQHWQEGSDDPHPSAKCALNILLYDQLAANSSGQRAWNLTLGLTPTIRSSARRK